MKLRNTAIALGVGAATAAGLYLLKVGNLFVIKSPAFRTDKENYSRMIYEGNSMRDLRYKLYLLEKYPISDGVWKFKTKTTWEQIKTPIMKKNSINKIKTPETSISKWQYADCYKSTINGKLIPAISRYGFERGSPELLRTICIKDYFQ